MWRARRILYAYVRISFLEDHDDSPGPSSSAIEPLAKSRKRGSKVLKAPVKADLRKHLAYLDCRAATHDIDSERNVCHATHSRSLRTTFLLQLLQSSSTVSRVRGRAYQKVYGVYTVRHVHTYTTRTCATSVNVRYRVNRCYAAR